MGMGLLVSAMLLIEQAAPPSNGEKVVIPVASAVCGFFFALGASHSQIKALRETAQKLEDKIELQTQEMSNLRAELAVAMSQKKETAKLDGKIDMLDSKVDRLITAIAVIESRIGIRRREESGLFAEPRRPEPPQSDPPPTRKK